MKQTCPCLYPSPPPADRNQKQKHNIIITIVSGHFWGTVANQRFLFLFPSKKKCAAHGET